MIWIITENKIEFKELFERLLAKGISSKFVLNPAEALKRLELETPQALLLNCDESEISAMEFCWVLKSSANLKKIKVYIFSKNKREEAEIKAFESGADDFILMPIKENVALLRILKRLNINNDVSTINLPSSGNTGLIIDKEAYSVFHNNTPIILSKKEFELLFLMASQPGKVFTREEILTKVWKRGPGKKDRTIDVHILRLRKKLGEDFFSTQKGIGYRFYARS